MKIRHFQLILLGLCSLIFPTLSYAQLSNTLYFSQHNPRQHRVNPATQPEGKFYVGVPALSALGVKAGNSRFSFQDLFQNIEVDGQKRTVFILDEHAHSVEDFYKKIKYKERLFASYDISLLDFGFRLKHNDYITVGVNTRMEAMAIIPHQFPDWFLHGMENREEYDFRLDKLSASALIFTEVAMGYSRVFDEDWHLGAKVKFLLGHGNVHTDFFNAELTGSEQEWALKGDAAIRGALPGLQIITDEKGRIKEVAFDGDQPLSSYTRPKGFGAALDLGVTYQLLPQLQLSASLLDLGIIRWGRDLVSLEKSSNFVYKGVEYDINNDTIDYYGEYKNQIDNFYTVNESPHNYSTSICAKILIGGEYAFWDGRVGVGILSKTSFYHRTAWEELVVSANFRPNRWVGASLAYNLFDGQWSNLSAGLNLNLGPVNLNMAVDNIPFKYGKTNGVLHPTDKRSVGAMVGLAVVCGYKEK